MATKYICILTSNEENTPEILLGCTEDVDAYVKRVNDSPAATKVYEVYATYKISANLTQECIRQVLDRLFPNKRKYADKDSCDLYTMTAHEAYDILDAAASISNTKGSLVCNASISDITNCKREASTQITLAEQSEPSSKRANRTLYKLGIPDGAKLVYREDSSKWVMVASAKKSLVLIMGEGELLSLSKAMETFSGKTNRSGPDFFLYEGTLVSKLPIVRD